MMTPEEYSKSSTKKYFKVCVIGGPGTGKTYFSATFKKFYSALTEPDSHYVWTTNPELMKNCVGWDYFVPSSVGNTKEVWDRLRKAVLTAKELFKQGKIETLILDNLTYLSENLWNYYTEHDPTGLKDDTRAQYGLLAREMYQFIVYSCLTFPGNFVLTIHEMMESDEAMQKKPDRTSPVVANVLGSFRNKVEGLFPVVLFLDKKETNDPKHPYKYIARTNKCDRRNAKNRFNLPSKMENICYDALYEAITNQGAKS